ncbi:diguanylate cyclase [Actinoplanes sp. NPDC048967]|uniref:diguanylate cyclase domain-containing protein n=1 Tax=Actinoplanes sp. NPDC048967 TaxID=3155269 RepID=UPI0033EB7A1B
MTTTHAPVDAGRLADDLLRLEIGRTASGHDDAAVAERIERDAAGSGRPDLVLRARLARAVVMLREGETVEGGRLIHRIHPEAVELGDDCLLARSHRALSIFFRQLGDNATALAHAVQCMSHTAVDVPPAIRSRHLMCLAVLLDETGSPQEALRAFTEALGLATAHHDSELALHLLNNMAYTAYERGDLPAAEELVRRMRATAESAGIPLSATCLDTLARVAMLGGRHREVEQILAPLLADDATRHRIDEGSALEEALLTAAEAYRELGAAERAQTLLDRLFRLCAEHDLAGLQAQGREQQALLHAATGRYQEAFEEYRRFHVETRVLTSAQQDARSRALQAVYQAEEARRATDTFRELAHRDALTGLHNRRHADEELPAALATAADGTPVSVALVDLDHFKRVNDTRSHATGDLVLRRLAGVLTAAAPPDSMIARLGGEEFVVLLPGTGAARARQTCERIRSAVAGEDWAALTGGLPVTCSIGVTTVTGAGATPAAALAAADRNLYAAKRAGRDRVFDDAVTAAA